MTREEILSIAKPILFNTDMTRAILDGRKTATRRKVEFLKGKNPHWTGYVKDGLMLYNGTNEPCIKPLRYKVGDYLYVREAFRLIDFSYIDGDWNASVQYRADDSIGMRLHNLHKGAEEKIGWRPSIHMPKEAARIFLRVTDVRVERLQDIEPVDVIKEGAYEDCWDCLDSYGESGTQCCYRGEDECSQCDSVMMEWEKLWNSTISKKELDKYGWDANPWVWVIEFERVVPE